MKLTNKYDHPEPIVQAVLRDPYTRGDSEFSATSLIQPPRIRVLTEKHKDEIEEDVDDKIFILIGQTAHTILERAGMALKDKITEKRFFGEVDGVKISAQIDSLCLDNGILTDWKTTSVFGFKAGVEPKWEWKAQLNIQLELLRQNNLDAKGLMIIGVLRDWRPGEAAKDPRYPKKIGKHIIPIEPREKTIQFIRDRIKAHRDANTTLPECNEHDHWNWKRCEMGYCNVAKFCEQFKQYKTAHKQHLKGGS